MHVSALDKALIFPLKSSGPLPVESLPLFTVTDLICFLSALKKEGQKVVFIKRINHGSLMQRCEGKPC